MFINKNAKWHWGVGQISLSTGQKIDEILTVDGNTSGNYGNYWGNLKDMTVSSILPLMFLMHLKTST